MSAKKPLSIGARLKHIRKREGWNQIALAELMGVKPPSLSVFESDKALPSIATLERFFQKAEYFPEWILFGRGPMKHGDPDPVEAIDMEALGRLPVELVDVSISDGELEDQEVAEFRRLPFLVDSVAAGAELIVRDQIQGWVVIHKDQLKGRHNVVAVRVEKTQGNSMFPTIRPGDIVAIDRDEINPAKYKRPRIFLIRTEDGLTIKRASLSGDKLILTADNPEAGWTPMIIDLEGRELSEVVIGRVFWQSSDAL